MTTADYIANDTTKLLMGSFNSSFSDLLIVVKQYRDILTIARMDVDFEDISYDNACSTAAAKILLSITND